MRDLTNWTARARPVRRMIEGRYAVLEPLDPVRHGDALFAASMAPGAEERFRYLFESPTDRPAFDVWLAKAAALDDPLAFAVLDRETGLAGGRQCLMRITPEHGVIEIGSILWGPAIARTRIATEALFLFASEAFDNLGYRRFEWKCNDLNEPSKAAALRFGFRFEGVFRHHMVAKGHNRDTAWFAMVDDDWPAIREAYLRWLDPANFDGEGRQLTRLEVPR